MAARQVDESEYLSSQAVVATVNQMLANPASRKVLLQARKIADPNAVIPEIDAAAPLQTEVSEMRRLLAEDRSERERERAAAAEQRQIADFQQKWDRQKAALRSKGFREEGIQAVETFAQENGIGDLSIAADAWERRNPPPEPAAPSGGSWNFFDQPAEDDTFVKTMLDTRGDNEAALDREIAASLKDFRSQSAARR
jgi:hypothetical protein